MQNDAKKRATAVPLAPQAANRAEREVFVAFVQDDTTRKLIGRAAAEQGWSAAKVFDGSVDTAIDALSGYAQTPRVLLIDLTHANDAVGDINRLAEVCTPGTRVVALGQTNDVELFRRLMHSGVDDYLVKPVRLEVLSHALARVSRVEETAKANAAPGKVVMVIGTRGGVGASSLSANLAWILANERGRRTALVDLDLQFGTAALALDLEPGRGLADALQNAGRIDDLLIERAGVRVNENLSVLSAEETLDHPIAIDAAAVRALTERLRMSFENVVVDLPRSQISVLPALVAEAEIIAVVTDYTLVSARDAPRLVRTLRSYAPKAQMLLIADRVGVGGTGELCRADLERVLEAKIDIEIPFDQRPANESAQTGKPLATAGKRSKAALALRQLADALTETKTVARTPFWRRLMGRSA